MNSALTFNMIVLAVFLVFYIRNSKKGKEVIISAARSLKAIAPLLIIIIIALIFMQVIFSEKSITGYINEFSGPRGYLVAVIFGAIIHIPMFIAFPVGGQLLQAGINPGIIAVLITSLVMVHFITIPVEIKELGLKFAVIRNLLSILFAVVIGIILGVLY